jgi:hypothetical protein
MGIQGVHSFLNNQGKQAVTRWTLPRGTVLAVDAFGFLFCLHDIYADCESEMGVVLGGDYKLWESWVEYTVRHMLGSGISMTFLVDGAPVDVLDSAKAKSKTNSARDASRANFPDEMQSYCSTGHIVPGSVAGTKYLPPMWLEAAQDVLVRLEQESAAWSEEGSAAVTVFSSLGEADDDLAQLVVTGEADAVLSCDTDHCFFPHCPWVRMGSGAEFLPWLARLQAAFFGEAGTTASPERADIMLELQQYNKLQNFVASAASSVSSRSRSSSDGSTASAVSNEDWPEAAAAAPAEATQMRVPTTPISANRAGVSGGAGLQCSIVKVGALAAVLGVPDVVLPFVSMCVGNDFTKHSPCLEVLQQAAGVQKSGHASARVLPMAAFVGDMYETHGLEQLLPALLQECEAMGAPEEEVDAFRDACIYSLRFYTLQAVAVSEQLHSCLEAVRRPVPGGGGGVQWDEAEVTQLVEVWGETAQQLQEGSRPSIPCSAVWMSCTVAGYSAVARLARLGLVVAKRHKELPLSHPSTNAHQAMNSISRKKILDALPRLYQWASAPPHVQAVRRLLCTEVAPTMSMLLQRPFEAALAAAAGLDRLVWRMNFTGAQNSMLFQALSKRFVSVADEAATGSGGQGRAAAHPSQVKPPGAADGTFTDYNGYVVGSGHPYFLDAAVCKGPPALHVAAHDGGAAAAVGAILSSPQPELARLCCAPMEQRLGAWLAFAHAMSCSAAAAWGGRLGAEWSAMPAWAVVLPSDVGSAPAIEAMQDALKQHGTLPTELLPLPESPFTADCAIAIGLQEPAGEHGLPLALAVGGLALRHMMSMQLLWAQQHETAPRDAPWHIATPAPVAVTSIECDALCGMLAVLAVRGSANPAGGEPAAAPKPHPQWRHVQVSHSYQVCVGFLLKLGRLCDVRCVEVLPGECDDEEGSATAEAHSAPVLCNMGQLYEGVLFHSLLESAVPNAVNNPADGLQRQYSGMCGVQGGACRCRPAACPATQTAQRHHR